MARHKLRHIAISVRDIAEAQKFFRDPAGIIFDLTASGWRGAVKNVKPAG